MKILLATYWLIPHVGGVWKYMTQVKERLEALGHEVDMLGNNTDYSKFHIYNREMELNKELIRPLLAAKLDAEHAPALHADPLIDFYERDRYILELSAAYFGLGQYDIINTQDIFAARALSRIKPPNTPLIAHLHGSVSGELHNHFRMNPQLGIHEQSPAWKYFESIEYFGAISADLTITANQWQKNVLVNQHGVPDTQVSVFQYGLDTATFWQKAQQGTEVQKPTDKKVIIFPARLVFVKGIDVLITALGLLKTRRQDWVCWIVGEGDKRKELEKQAAGLNLQDDVIFWGERDDVPALLAKSDIFVHSCLQDNQPFSVMEAQIAGLATCVSNAGGLPEMVEHGRTGLVSPVRDPLALFEQLNSLLADDEYRTELGRNAQSWAINHWSMDLMIDRLLQVYHAAISARNHS